MLTGFIIILHFILEKKMFNISLEVNNAKEPDSSGEKLKNKFYQR